MVQHREAFSAEGVTAVNKNPWYPFANVELVATVVAEIEAPALVVGLD